MCTARFGEGFGFEFFFHSQAESTPAPAPQPEGLVRKRKPLGSHNTISLNR